MRGEHIAANGHDLGIMVAANSRKVSNWPKFFLVASLKEPLELYQVEQRTAIEVAMAVGLVPDLRQHFANHEYKCVNTYTCLRD